VGRTFAAMRFCEKPDLRTARRFLKAGNYLWNSGMFVWKVSEIMSEFKRQMPSLYRLCLDLERAWGKPCEKRAIAGFYRKAESQSIDYGIMENARKVAVIRASFHWDDVGSWEALWRVRKVDCDGNVTQGKALSVENENSLLFAEDGLVVGAGLRNMVVVQSRGATLVLPRSRLKDMKKLIALVRKREDMKAFLE
jgi:mannose-1-phosphate guanylyltransferase